MPENTDQSAFMNSGTYLLYHILKCVVTFLRPEQEQVSLTEAFGSYCQGIDVSCFLEARADPEADPIFRLQRNYQVQGAKGHMKVMAVLPQLSKFRELFK